MEPSKHSLEACSGGTLTGGVLLHDQKHLDQVQPRSRQRPRAPGVACTLLQLEECEGCIGLDERTTYNMWYIAT